jgi:hypothetical protein
MTFRVVRDVTLRRNCIRFCLVLRVFPLSPEQHCSTVGLTVVHGPRVYRLKAGTTTVCAIVYACIPDQHVGFPSL